MNDKGRNRVWWTCALMLVLATHLYDVGADWWVIPLTLAAGGLIWITLRDAYDE